MALSLSEVSLHDQIYVKLVMNDANCSLGNNVNAYSVMSTHSIKRNIIIPSFTICNNINCIYGHRKFRTYYFRNQNTRGLAARKKVKFCGIMTVIRFYISF